MSTISSYLKTMDQFNRSLQRLNHGVQAAIIAMERFKQVAGASVTKSTNNTSTPAPALAWETWTAPDIFQSTGVERYAQEIEDLKSKIDVLAESQQMLDMSNKKFLPPQAVGDIDALQQRLQNLGAMLQKVEVQKDALSSNADPKALESLNGSVENIRNSIQMAIDQQEALNKAMKDADAANVQHIYTNLNNIIDTTEDQIRNNTKEQELFNQTIEKGEKAAGGLQGKIFGSISKYIGKSITAVKEYLQASRAAANSQLAVEQRLQVVMGSTNGMTRDGIELVKQRARELEGTTTISAGVGIAGQTQLAEYVHDPTNIAGMTEAMYNLAAGTYGANVSAEQLQQTASLIGKAMQGDINALNANGLKIGDVFTEAEQNMFKTGTEAERAAMVIKMIDQNLAGLAEAMGNTPEGQVMRIAHAWQSVQEKVGYGIMPLIGQLTTFILANMPIIESVILTVFSSIIDIIQGVLDVAIATAGFIIANWSWIEPVLWGIVAALSAFLIMTNAVAVATRIAAIAQAIYDAILKANPFVLIATLIIGVITALVMLWQTNDAFAAGLMRAWNAILNFFAQIPIFFAIVGYGIINAFQNAKVTSLQLMEDLVNGIIDGINSLIATLNNIPGVSLNAIGHVNFTTDAAAKATAAKQAGNTAIAQMQADAAAKVQEREQKVIDMLDDRAAERAQKQQEKDEKFKAPELPGAGNLGIGVWDVGDGRLQGGIPGDAGVPEVAEVGKVGQVDKIKNTVDISSEDLKMMRELAEMNNIQNFVSLQPSINFGDTHVRRESDLNTIVARITEKLNEDIASSVDAVYT